ncbi:MAG: hypothetical protein R3274_08580 [Desulfobacterales bacterium]|nr:hypothetical protein [Desulfobacterales bacterium]
MGHHKCKSLLSLLVISFMAFTSADGKAEENVILDQLLTEVQKTLIRVSTASEEDKLPPLHRITLQLKSALATKADGKIVLFIVQLGAKVENEAVQEIHLELKPPKPAEAALVRSVEDALASAIIEAAESAHRASKRKPPLYLSKLTAQIRFVVKTEGSGAVNFKLLPVTVKLGGKVKEVNTQQITVEFKIK